MAENNITFPCFSLQLKMFWTATPSASMNAREPWCGPGRSLQRKGCSLLPAQRSMCRTERVVLGCVVMDWGNDIKGQAHCCVMSVICGLIYDHHRNPNENDTDRLFLGSTTKALNCPQDHAGERQEVPTQPSWIFWEKHGELNKALKV